jgi:hypothetical protein
MSHGWLEVYMINKADSGQSRYDVFHDQVVCMENRGECVGSKN